MALGENPGRELVFGAVGRPWQPSIEWRRVESRDFTPFDEPDWAKMAAALVVHPYGTSRSLLTYEARTACTDPASDARFGRYWALVSPASASCCVARSTPSGPPQSNLPGPTPRPGSRTLGRVPHEYHARPHRGRLDADPCEPAGMRRSAGKPSGSSGRDDHR
ncbi:hypothetical protein ACFQ0M_49490 [Kitasatospora aburaviensis]